MPQPATTAEKRKCIARFTVVLIICPLREIYCSVANPKESTKLLPVCQQGLPAGTIRRNRMDRAIRSLPVRPQVRTFSAPVGMSQRCHKQASVLREQKNC